MQSISNPFDKMFIAEKMALYHDGEIIFGDYKVVQYTGEKSYLFPNNKFHIQKIVTPGSRVAIPEIISKAGPLVSIKERIIYVTNTIAYTHERAIGELFKFIILSIANYDPFTLRILYTKLYSNKDFDKIINKYSSGYYGDEIRELSLKLHSANVKVENDEEKSKEEEE